MSVLKTCNTNMTKSDERIEGAPTFMHCFYSSMIQLQYTHVASKNFISDYLHHIIILNIF
jgi:hypothetical protein